MKLKYKKMILIISMSAMGIGMVTLSLSKPKDKSDGKKADTVMVTAEGTQDKSTDVEDTAAKIELVGQPGDGVLRMDIYPAINELVKKYMSAKGSCDYDTLRTLVNDSSVIDEDDLRAKSEYIEDYRNIVCYTLNGPTEDSFIVYVYEDLKILNVNTLAPGMTRLYIKLDESGSPYVYLGAIDDETQNFIKEASNNQSVIDVIDSVNKKLDEAITKDEDLKKFIEERSSAAASEDSKSSDKSDKKATKDDEKDNKSDEKTTKDKKSTKSDKQDSKSSDEGSNN
ncbi:hypothetical protein [Anaerosporobacter sp.]